MSCALRALAGWLSLSSGNYLFRQPLLRPTPGASGRPSRTASSPRSLPLIPDSAFSDSGLLSPHLLSGKSAACPPKEFRPDGRVNEAAWAAGFGRQDQRAFRPGSSAVPEAFAGGGFRRSTPCQSGPQKSPIPAAESQQLKATTGGRNRAHLRAGKQALGSSPQAVPQAPT
jgi:hypothetical protein